jgi:hypothetical protein
MKYCPVCETLCEEDDTVCKKCKNKKLRPVQDNDPVFLTETSGFDVSRIEGVLTDENIPFMQKDEVRERLPSALFGPDTSKRVNFYVPYGTLTKARELLESIGAAEEPGTQAPNASVPAEPEEEIEQAQMSPAKRMLWRVISILLFIVLVGAVVFGTDALTGWIKGLL